MIASSDRDKERDTDRNRGPETVEVPVVPETLNLQPETVLEPEPIEAQAGPEPLNLQVDLEPETALETAEAALLAEALARSETLDPGLAILPPEATLSDVALAEEVEAEEAASDAALEEQAFLTSYSLLPTPSFSLNDVRELIQAEMAVVHEGLSGVRAELAQLREDAPALVQAELLRQQQDRYIASLAALQEVASEFSELKPDLLRIELRMLDEEEPRVLQAGDLSVREKIEALDFIRAHRSNLKRQLAEVEAEVARRTAETSQELATLEGRRLLHALRQEVEGQKESVARVEGRLQQVAAGVEARARHVVDAALTAVPKTPRWASWPILAGFLLVLVIGGAGIILPWRGPAQIAEADIYLELATLYQATNHNQEAEQALGRAVKAGLVGSANLARAASVYAQFGRMEQSIAAYEEAIAGAEGGARQGYQATLVEAYIKAGQPDQAVALYQQMAYDYPAAAVGYYEQAGKLLYDMKDFPRAIVLYQKALEKGGSLTTYIYLGEIYYTQKRYEDAVKMFREVLALKPDHYLAHFRIGEYYFQYGDCYHALEEFTQAAQADPKSDMVFVRMASCYMKANNYQVAIEYYKTAVANNPKNVGAMVGLGQTYAALGECEQAIKQFNDALEIDSSSQVALDGLNQCAVTSTPTPTLTIVPTVELSPTSTRTLTPTETPEATLVLIKTPTPTRTPEVAPVLTKTRTPTATPRE